MERILLGFRKLQLLLTMDRRTQRDTSDNKDPSNTTSPHSAEWAKNNNTTTSFLTLCSSENCSCFASISALVNLRLHNMQINDGGTPAAAVAAPALATVVVDVADAAGVCDGVACAGAMTAAAAGAAAGALCGCCASCCWSSARSKIIIPFFFACFCCTRGSETRQTAKVRERERQRDRKTGNSNLSTHHI